MKIWVSNLDPSTDEDEIFGLFEEIGTVNSVELGEMPDPGLDTFTAEVDMEYDDEATQALQELHGERIDGRILSVKSIPPQFQDTDDEDLLPADADGYVEKQLHKLESKTEELPRRNVSQRRRS